MECGAKQESKKEVGIGEYLNHIARLERRVSDTAPDFLFYVSLGPMIRLQVKARRISWMSVKVRFIVLLCQCRKFWNVWMKVSLRVS